MSLPGYVVSVMTGRIRLRHTVFKKADLLAKAEGILKGMKKVHEVRSNPVTGSLLVVFEPALSLERLCEALEQEVPQLHDRSPKDGKSAGKSLRRLELRLLLLLLAAGVVSSFTLGERVHMASAGSFLVFVLRHIWMRRQAM